MPLTPDEKAHLKALIDADAPLPPGFRARLFPQPPGVELIWPGKGATSTDPVADRPELRVVDRYSAAGDGWRDTLIHGDNAAVLRALSHGPHREAIDAAGGLRLIYLDPPFLTGRAFAAEAPVGETLPGEPVRTIRLPAYRDEKTGGLATYLDAMLVRLRLMHDLLADDGSLYLHCDHRLSAAMRLLLDEVFGPDRLVNEIVWQYGLGNPGGRRAFARKHDTILLYGKTDRYRFNRLRGEITPAMTGKYRHEDESGRYLISYGKKYYLQGGKPLDTVWAISTLGATDTERVGYPTQKPEALLERILLASSDPGDLVADFCCGSGTLPAVAGRLGRRWLAADAGLRAIQTTRTRLLRGGAERFDLVALDGPTTAPLSTGPAAILSASVVVMAGTIRVRLTGYDVSASDHRDPAIRTWSDWIETWAVAIEDPATSAIPRPFTPVWWAVRSGRGRALALASDPIPAPDPHTRRVTVKIVDVLGRETWAIIPVDDPSSEIQQSGPAPTNAASNVSSTPISIRTIVPVPSSAPNDGDAT